MRASFSALQPRLLLTSVLCAPFLLGACGGVAHSSAGTPRTPATQTGPGAVAQIGAPATVTGTAAPARPPLPGVALLPRLPEITLDPKAPLRPLPELKLENIGLHVGGGPNDADTKAPFQRAVAARFPQFMDCYRKNEDPAKGGRFGIDLHIARTGGHPKVEQPRTAMHGPEFRACLESVFESVEFERPKKGPTTISYSLHFTLADAP